MKETLLDPKGKPSNSRAAANKIINAALIGVQELFIIKIAFPSVDLVLLATAGGMLFASIAGPALIFLFAQKKEEGKQLETEIQNK